MRIVVRLGIAFVFLSTAGLRAAELREDRRPAGIRWQAAGEYESLRLSVGGPSGAAFEWRFLPGEEAYFDLTDSSGRPLADGRYHYEISLVPLLSDELRARLQEARQAGDQQLLADLREAAGLDEESMVRRGSFRIENGSLAPEPAESSAAQTMPQWEWSEDMSGDFQALHILSGRTPLEIESGAPDAALHVAAAGVGIGTTTPQRKLHLKSPDTPSIRLEQTDTGGLPPQIWDVGFDMSGNEQGFFLFDGTNFEFPFRVRPGAPTSSLEVDSYGRVGLGTAAPEFQFHIYGIDATPGQLNSVQAVIENAEDVMAAGRDLLSLRNNGPARITFTHTGTGLPGGNPPVPSDSWALGQSFDYSDFEFSFADQGAESVLMTLSQLGELQVSSKVSAPDIDATTALFLQGVDVTTVFAPQARLLNTENCLSGGGDLMDDRTFGLDLGCSPTWTGVHTFDAGLYSLQPVGIGTTAPASLLHLLNPSAFADMTIESGGAFAARLDLKNTAATWRLQNGGQGIFRIRDETAGTDPLEISSGAPTDSLYIDASGKFGIGTASPDQKLHVAGDILSEDVSPSVTYIETDATADNGYWDMVANAEQFRFRISDDAHSAYHNWLTVDRTGTTVDTVAIPQGSFCIGCSSAGAPLDVQGGTTNFLLNLESSDPTATMALSDSTGGAVWRYTSSGLEWQLDSPVTTRMSLSTAGLLDTGAGYTENGSDTLSNNISGNAATATALAADPPACPAGQAVQDIDASGNPSCIDAGGGGAPFDIDALPLETVVEPEDYLAESESATQQERKISVQSLLNVLPRLNQTTGVASNDQVFLYDTSLGNVRRATTADLFSGSFPGGGLDEQILTRETAGGPFEYENLCDNISGTTNQITVSGTTNCTLSTPQDLDTSADVTFNNLNLDYGLIKHDGVAKINLNYFADDIGFLDDLDRNSNWKISASEIPPLGVLTLQGSYKVKINQSLTTVASFGYSNVNLSIPSTGEGNAVRITAAGDLFEDTSSARFKTNIQDAPLKSEAIYSLKPRFYQRKGTMAWEFGYVAEEVAEVLPEFVNYDADGRTPRGVKMAEMVMLLVEEVKKLRAEVDELKGRPSAPVRREPGQAGNRRNP